MAHLAKIQVLVVDDEPALRQGLAMILEHAGYAVSLAQDGFDALLQLRSSVPAVIISDLNMPNMSGFEFLSVVRRRFPTVAVIAVSGAYESGEHVPGGIIADAFYAKGRHFPEELVQKVGKLIEDRAAQVRINQHLSAPVWIPRNGKDSRGVPYIVITCTECLRSFPLSVTKEDISEIQETPCFFCGTPVRYIIDFSRTVASPRHTIIAENGSPPKPNP